MQRALAISAQAATAGEPSLANAQRAAAHVAAVNASARGPEKNATAAFAALQSLPTAVIQHDAGISDGAFAPQGSDFALAAGSSVSLHDVTGRARWTTQTAPWIEIAGRTPASDVRGFARGAPTGEAKDRRSFPSPISPRPVCDSGCAFQHLISTR